MAEITIEMSDKNKDPLFPPLRYALRGRFERFDLPPGTTSNRGLLKISAIPGMYISLDVHARRARVYDPMSMDKVKAAEVSTWLLGVQGKSYKPGEERVYENMNDDLLATFLWWMRRFVDDKMAVLISGHFPKDGPKGRICHNIGYTGREEPRYLDQMPDQPVRAEPVSV